MDLVQIYRDSVAGFTDLVARVGADDWHAPTPCGDWDVRALVAHVVDEQRWSVPMLAGVAIDEVADRFADDPLGTDPAATARETAAASVRAVAAPGALNGTAHLSAGDTPAREYVHQLMAEHLVHGWDLAAALGQRPALDPGAVRACAAWFDERSAMYRDSGLTGPGVDLPADAGPQDRLVAAFGRDPNWHRPRR